MSWISKILTLSKSTISCIHCKSETQCRCVGRPQTFKGSLTHWYLTHFQGHMSERLWTVNKVSINILLLKKINRFENYCVVIKSGKIGKRHFKKLSLLSVSVIFLLQWTHLDFFACGCVWGSFLFCVHGDILSVQNSAKGTVLAAIEVADGPSEGLSVLGCFVGACWSCLSFIGSDLNGLYVSVIKQEINYSHNAWII